MTETEASKGLITNTQETIYCNPCPCNHYFIFFIYCSIFQNVEATTKLIDPKLQRSTKNTKLSEAEINSESGGTRQGEIMISDGTDKVCEEEEECAGGGLVMGL